MSGTPMETVSSLRGRSDHWFDDDDGDIVRIRVLYNTRIVTSYASYGIFDYLTV